MITIIIIAIIIYVIYNKKKKAKQEQEEARQELFSEFDEKVPNPKTDFREIILYFDQPLDFELKEDVRVNKRTGYPLAKQTSIDRSRNEFKEVMSFPNNNYYEIAKGNSEIGINGNSKMAIDDYLLSIELPFHQAGILAYKQGDWDLAEKWWLSVLDIRPTNVLHRLKVMYRKQHRYKDIVELYKIAEPLVKNYDFLTGENTYTIMFEKDAVFTEEKHKYNDQSLGVTLYPSKIDQKYLKLLQSVGEEQAE
jgi:tetratricopeptide (TPR) repeat protein